MTHHEGDNIESLKSIEVIQHDLPTSLKPLTLTIGKEWITILFKDETGIMQIKTEETPNGIVFTYSGSFFIHHLRDEVDQVLLPFLGRAVSILRLTDMNDRVYIIGSPDCPVLLNLSASTGQKYVNENGGTYNFSVQQTSPAVSA